MVSSPSMPWRTGGWVYRTTSRGNVFSFWMPSMPRIRDAYLDCVIYLYPSEHYAEVGARMGGSGFLVGIPTGQAGMWLTYAVTNRHVVERGGHVIRVSTKDGGKEI